MESVNSIFFEASCPPKKKKASWPELCNSGIRVACVYLLITATLILCAEVLADHYSAGFSSLNIVGVRVPVNTIHTAVLKSWVNAA